VFTKNNWVSLDIIEGSQKVIG